MIKIKQIIADFFITNKYLRRIRIFLRYSLFPTLFKIFLVILFLLLCFAGYMVFSKTYYVDKIFHKVSPYIYKILNIDNKPFAKINISGLNKIKESEIISIVDALSKDYSEKNEAKIVEKIAIKIKQDLSWVNEVLVVRSLPNILNITIEEFIPFAVWQDENEQFFTDKNGKLVPYENIEGYKYMVILSGKNANNNVSSLFNIFFIDPNLSAKVYSANWVSNRRWDIRLEDGTLVKLPEENIDDAWQILKKLYETQGSMIGIKMIDLRILNKIYLEYNEEISKEIREL